jgi:ABC-type anion transport system duplicated permease subunit
MVIPIIFIYGLGLAFFILGCEGMGVTDRSITNIIYLVLASFLNGIGYYVSYSNTDYVSLAYIPLSFLAITIIMMIYTAWQMIPISQSWDDRTEEGEF